MKCSLNWAKHLHARVDPCGLGWLFWIGHGCEEGPQCFLSFSCSVKYICTLLLKLITPASTIWGLSSLAILPLLENLTLWVVSQARKLLCKGVHFTVHTLCAWKQGRGWVLAVVLSWRHQQHLWTQNKNKKITMFLYAVHMSRLSHMQCKTSKAKQQVFVMLT